MGGMALPPDVVDSGHLMTVGTPARTTGIPVIDVADERAARRSLHAQIARLERDLADAFVTAFPMGGLEQPAPVTARPRLLGLGELEVVRDELAERLHTARVTISRCADEQAQKRMALERMLLAPAEHRFERVSRSDLGEPGCGVWQVRPRLGLIGMLMGWWQVKLSSGCPLPGGHGPAGRRPVARLVLTSDER
ncbi:MAG: hypothetical protein WBQ18_18555 [Solirubrobacteraceae bacterium]|jgi:hypothetical protein